MNPESPRKRSESPQGGSERRFNPFVNEEDMFRVVLWAAGIALALILLVVVARSIF